MREAAVREAAGADEGADLRAVVATPARVIQLVLERVRADRREIERLRAANAEHVARLASGTSGAGKRKRIAALEAEVERLKRELRGVELRAAGQGETTVQASPLTVWVHAPGITDPDVQEALRVLLLLAIPDVADLALDFAGEDVLKFDTIGLGFDQGKLA